MADRRGGAKPGSGRPRGKPNHWKGDLAQEIRREYFKRGLLDKVFELAECSDKQVALRANQELLDRGWGRPAQQLELSGQVNLVEVLIQARRRAEDGDRGS